MSRSVGVLPCQGQWVYFHVKVSGCTSVYEQAFSKCVLSKRWKERKIMDFVLICVVGFILTLAV